MIGPWQQPAPEKQQSKAISQRISTAVTLLLLTAIFFGGLLLARHNLKLGQGDRKGAFRLVVFLLVLGGIGSLTGRHAPEFTTELGTLIERFSHLLLLAAVTWLIYIGLEPFLRRRWPNLIISWNRLLAGNYRDPLIGREILIGGVCGLGIWLLGFTPQIILKWLGKPYDINLFSPPVQGLRSLIARFADDLAASLVIPMSVLLLGLLLSIVLRKRWLAAVVIWLLVTAGIGLTTSSLTAFICAGIGSALAVMVIMRYGMLTAYFCFLFINVLSDNATTTNFSVWYSESTIFVLTICTGLIIYGFYTSLAGQQLFRGKLLNE